MSALPLPYPMSEADYLAFERASASRHEYLYGQIVAMAGGTANHVRIVRNVLTRFTNQQQTRKCEAFMTDLRVKMFKTYAYPDVVVVCGEARFSDTQKDTLLNPSLIVEVLSPSTEIYDRGAKFSAYQSIAELRDYLLISQDSLRVEHYTRHEAGWFLRIFTQMTDVIALPNISAELLLADIYERVVLDDLSE